MTTQYSCKNNVVFTEHFKERLKQREINLDLSTVNINEIIKMPYYKDTGCYKFLDHKRQVIFYIRHSNNTFKIETIIKTNPIQMLKNMCDAHRMLCEQKYHKKNKCKYCKLWNFNNICRDNLFGECTRYDNCKFNHIKMP
jgi:hypothetical protein